MVSNKSFPRTIERRHTSRQTAGNFPAVCVEVCLLSLVLSAYILTSSVSHCIPPCRRFTVTYCV